MIAKLLLSNGDVFEGISVGADGTFCGEITFDTSMAGYQEVLENSAYSDKIVVMTYPEIGNCGITKKNLIPTVKGLIVKNYCQNENHYLSKESLASCLKENNIIGISEIDTRKLTKTIKNSDKLTCLITTEEITEEMKNKLNNRKQNKNITPQQSESEIEEMNIKKCIGYLLYSLNFLKHLYMKYIIIVIMDNKTFMIIGISILKVEIFILTKLNCFSFIKLNFIFFYLIFHINIKIIEK